MMALLKSFTEVLIHQSKLMESKGTDTEVEGEIVVAENPHQLDLWH